MARFARAFAALLTALAIPFSATAETAPDCRLKSAGNAAIDLSSYRGKVVYLDFWASWCTTCQLSFPFMNQLRKTYAGRGLAVVAVNLDAHGKDAQAFLGRHPAQFDLALGDNTACAKRFRVKAMPTSFLIDRRGNIRAAHPGFSVAKTAGVKAEIERLLGESAT